MRRYGVEGLRSGDANQESISLQRILARSLIIQRVSQQSSDDDSFLLSAIVREEK
jgi:hypothetical protein